MEYPVSPLDLISTPLTLNSAWDPTLRHCSLHHQQSMGIVGRDEVRRSMSWNLLTRLPRSLMVEG